MSAGNDRPVLALPAAALPVTALPLAALLLCLSGLSASFPARAAEPTWDWSGLYLGGHVGAFTGTTSFSNPQGAPIFGDSVATPGFLGGLQVGYNQQLAPQWLVGAELSGSVLASQGQNTCFQSSITFVGSNCKVTPREIATLTGRVGWLTEAHGRTMLFGRAGVAWMRNSIEATPANNNSPGFTLTGTGEAGESSRVSSGVWGFTVGAGLERAVADNWSVSVGYDYVQLGGLGMPAPASVDITTAGNASAVPGGAQSTATQNLHIVRVALNYHWGSMARGSGEPSRDSSREDAAAPWVAGWEVEGGARYWYSWGNFQSANGPTSTTLVSRLSYNNMEGHSGELFGRVDAPFGVFAKGLFGSGGISRGTMYDEDWGLSSALAAEPTGYEITQSGLSGSFNYLNADLGYNLLRGRDHKVGLFVGYHRYQTIMNANGCAQMVAPGSGVCFPNVASDTIVISELNTWQALRLGSSVELKLGDRLKVAGDFAFLPYVTVQSLDVHRLRSLNFPATGTGMGVQAEIMLSYRVLEALSVGLGARYWSMWTTNAWQTDATTNIMTLSTDRYGVLAQLSYRFN